MTYPLWHPDTTVPTRDELTRPNGARDVLVHHGDTDRYHFLHDTCIAAHDGELHTAWYNCPDREIHGESVIRGRRSPDAGQTWSDVETILADESGEGLHSVPPQLYVDSGKLYCFVGVMVGPDLIRRCDLYVRDDKSGMWQLVGKIADAFQQNTAPVRMANGEYILPGRRSAEIDGYSDMSAVAICDRIDGDWQLVTLPTGDLCKPHPETTVYADTDHTMGTELISALVRNDGGFPQVFESRDFGRTWFGPISQNMPIGAAKMYAGKLSTGQRYLLSNVNSDGYRELLTISVSAPDSEQLSRMWSIRNGADWSVEGAKIGSEWSYPSAIENDGMLYVVYTSEKRHCAMTAIPVESLAV
jgi:hypothetical protein